MFASGLHALLQVLDVREDIYSVGHTSRLIATELESYSPARSRRKVWKNLITPLSYLSTYICHSVDLSVTMLCLLVTFHNICKDGLSSISYFSFFRFEIDHDNRVSTSPMSFPQSDIS